MANQGLDTVIGMSEAARRDPQAAAKQLGQAQRLIDMGDRAGAIAELRKASAADPTNAEILFRLAYLLDLVGEEDEALAMYESCIEQPPAMINALINLAIMYEDREDYGRAERCLRQVLDTHPNHPRARLYMKDVQASREMSIARGFVPAMSAILLRHRYPAAAPDPRSPRF